MHNRNQERNLLWERFADTGAVGAYLLYCAVREHEPQQTEARGKQ